jgi:hypothetical protein
MNHFIIVENISNNNILLLKTAVLCDAKIHKIN